MDEQTIRRIADLQREVEKLKTVESGTGGGGPGSDTTAIHDNVSAEISAITEKTTPVGDDLLVIEDSAASNAKKKLKISNLPGGGSGDVVGPGSATDNALVRFDGTTGKLIQNSNATLDDAGTMNLAASQQYNVNGAQHVHVEGDVTNLLIDINSIGEILALARGQAML